MNKRLWLIGMVMLIAFAAFAEEIKVDKSVGLKDSDVKSFSKNYLKMKKDLENYDELFNTDASAMAKMSTVMEGMSAANIVTDIMNKNGISGKNAIEKFTRICYYASILAAGRALEKAIAENPALAAYIAAADPYAEIRKKMDPSDTNAVKANIDELIKTLELETKK